MTQEEIANIIVQLRSLATENRIKADFFELAATLHETGYKSDQQSISIAVAQQLSAAVAAETTSLREQISQLETKLQTQSVQ